MTSLAELLEDELEEAVEVKNRRSLHRCVALLVGSIVEPSEYLKVTESLNSDIRVIAETVKEGFRRMDERFEAVDKRFAAVDKRFEAVDKRFEAVDKRFEDMHALMNARFEATDKRFEDMNRRFTMMFSFMTVGFTMLALLMSAYRFLVP